MQMQGGPQNSGQFVPPPHSQMHPNPMMLSVGGPGMPGGLPGLHYGPHGPLPPMGPMPPGAERGGEHAMPPMQPGQQPPPQLGAPLLGQHHHGPPAGAMGIPTMGPHQQIPPGALPPHGHPHHLHHPPPGPIPMHRSALQPEFRIYELNRRLQQRTDDMDGQWWEAFAADFFDDDATITITVRLEDGPKHFNIGRTLIPRYFRSLFDSGCDEIFFSLRHTHEAFHNSVLTLNSDSANMVMNVVRPLPSTIIVEAQFTLGFTLDEFMRIRSWTFQIRSHRELIMRSMLGIQDPALFEQVCKNISRSGIMSNTLHFLRLCVILEPMQELMSRQKFQNLSPRECLRTTLMHRWKRINAMQNVAPKPDLRALKEEIQACIEANRQPSKRRKRKGSAANSEAGAGRATKRKQSPVPVPPQGLAQPGDIMIVGEPTLMGGEFGEDDERIITRLENSQYDPAAAAIVAQQQMAAAGMGIPTSSGAVGGPLPPFSRPPAFPPAFHPGGGGQSPMMYAPGPPYSSSPSFKPQQSPHYGHPNSVPAPPYGTGVGGPMMPASVPPPHGARIMSPMTSAGCGSGVGGNPATPGGGCGNAQIMFAPPPSIAGSEPGGMAGAGSQQLQPPRSSSAGDGPAFPPPPPPPTHTYQPLQPPSSHADPRVTPPLTLMQQQQQQLNGPFQGQKSPPVNSPGTAGLQFPPPLTSFCGGSNRASMDSSVQGGSSTPRLQPSSQQTPDGLGPGSIGRGPETSGSETPNPNGYPADQAPSTSKQQQPSAAQPPPMPSAASPNSSTNSYQRTMASSNGAALPPPSEPDLSAFGVDPTTAPVSNAPPPLIEEADGYEMPHKPTKNEKNDCNAVDDANDNSELPTNSVGGSSVLSVVKFPDSEMHEGVAAATALTAADDS